MSSEGSWPPVDDTVRGCECERERDLDVRTGEVSGFDFATDYAMMLSFFVLYQLRIIPEDLHDCVKFN